MWLFQNFKLSFVSFIVLFCFYIAAQIFLNVISLTYTNVDLFKIDIAEVKKQNKRLMEKLEFVIKKSYSVNFSISLFQTVVTVLISISRTENSSSWKANFSAVIFAVVQMIILESVPVYLVKGFNSRPEYLLNWFFLNTAYFVAKVSPFAFILSSSDEKKIFSHNEEDIIRFVNNLTSKEILLLEPKEAQLVNLAFRLDDRDIKSIYVPKENVVFLKTSMKKCELKEAWKKKNLTKYPVLDENGSFIGVLNTRTLLMEAVTNEKFALEKEGFWIKHVNKKQSFMSTSTKLSEALEVLKSCESHFSVVKEKEEIVGIITLNDVLSSLVGKISDES